MSCGRALTLLVVLGVAACRGGRGAPPPATAPAPATTTPDVTPAQVALHYAKLASASYADATSAARALQASIDAFVASPTAAGLATARDAWLAARAPYLQTEAFRFYDGPIDRLEMLINGWPVDENYIDYVTGAPEAGIVNDAKAYPRLSEALLVSLNEKEGEKNISTGFHAIEFLLWGQDTRADGPGGRTATDFLPPAPAAKRRGQYLSLAAALLARHLGEVSAEWAPGRSDNYRARFLSLPPAQAVRAIVKGLGSLSGPELTGERLTVAYVTKDQENEHSCFSDSTHTDVVGDLLGIQDVCLGRLVRADGAALEGPGLVALLAADDQPLARALEANVAASLAAARGIPAPFDQAVLGRDDAPGRRAIKATIAALEEQTATLARVAAKLGLRWAAPLAVAR